MYHARGIVTEADTANTEQQKSIKAIDNDDKTAKTWMENWYDGLTYCEYLYPTSSQYLTVVLTRYLERTWPTTH
jgi:hypothetical protein